MIKNLHTLLVIAMVASFFVGCEKQEKLSNIVFYITDDQSQLDSSVYGNELIRTPNNGRLACAGITFENTYVAEPACSPSRAPLLTGLTPSRNRAEKNDGDSERGTQILIENLQDRGYKVLNFGKIAHNKYGEKIGFEYYDAGTKVPLVMVWPGQTPPSTRTNAVVSWVDIFPTLLDLISAETLLNLDGGSFRDVVIKDKEEHRRYMYITHSGDRHFDVFPLWSVADGKYKYNKNLYPQYYHSNILRKEHAGAYWNFWDALAKKDSVEAATVKRYYVREVVEFCDLNKKFNEHVNLIHSTKHAEHLWKMKNLLNVLMVAQNDY